MEGFPTFQHVNKKIRIRLDFSPFRLLLRPYSNRNYCEQHIGPWTVSKQKKSGVMRLFFVLWSSGAASGLHGPGQAVGDAADVEMTGDFERFEIDDGDIIIGGAGDEGAGAFRIHENAGGAMTDL